MDKAEALAIRKKHKSTAAAARAAGMPRTTLRDRLNGHRPGVKIDHRETTKSLAAFRRMYDKSVVIPVHIRAALKALGSGWEYEAELAKRAGISRADLVSYKDKFIQHIVLLREGRRVWAGSVKMAEAMRNMV